MTLFRVEANFGQSAPQFVDWIEAPDTMHALQDWRVSYVTSGAHKAQGDFSPNIRPATAKELETFKAIPLGVRVAEILSDWGIDARWAHPGVVNIAYDTDTEWNFGTLNPQWDGELLTVSGQVLAVAKLPFPSDQTTGAKDIARAIATVLLADKFSHDMRQTITREELAIAVRLNKTADYVNCDATHDFTDSNQVMLNAFEHVFRRPVLLVENCEDNPTLEAAQDFDRALWNTAWDLAKAANYARTL